MPYKSGDYKVVCDYSGFECLRSECRMTWDNKLVRADFWEARHPLDLIRARADRQVVPDPRPVQTDYFLEANEVKAEDL